MTGTELEIIPPAHGGDRRLDGRAAARGAHQRQTDQELLAVWLKSHADGSPHTLRAYERIGSRFLEALAAEGESAARDG